MKTQGNVEMPRVETASERPGDLEGPAEETSARGRGQDGIWAACLWVR